MIKVENINVMNLDGAIRGVRNPLESWSKSDSKFIWNNITGKDEFIIGEKDMKLAQNLIKAGSDERKFMRQILVCFDITAPIYWWKEFDTYKVATVANSTSTMHKMGSRELVPDDFSWDSEDGKQFVYNYRRNMLNDLNLLIRNYKDCDDPIIKKNIWRRLIQDLPSSFNQMRTITLNYEVLRNIYFARRNHKLIEWRNFCDIIKSLPYAEELICVENK